MNEDTGALIGAIIIAVATILFFSFSIYNAWF